MNPINKFHRTALVIDARKGFTGEFAERVGRLLQSLNGGNIKVDIYTLGPVPAVQTTTGFTAGPPNTVTAHTSVSAPSIDDVKGQLRSAGYAQILTSEPA